jgi:protein TonB
MTAAWRLVPTDPFRARTRNPALALAILAHLMLLGALAASALLRVTPIPEDAFILPTVLRITLPPPPLEPVTPAPPQVAGTPFDVRIPRAPAPPRRTETAERLPDLPGGGPDVGDVDGLPPGFGALVPGIPGGEGPGDGNSTGPGPGDASGPGDDDGPLPIGGGIAKPTLLHKVEPEYPTIARLSRIPGNVTVQAVIGRDGNVEDAEIVSSSNRLFDEAALEAVRQWRYAPAMLNGRPVRVTFRVHVEFTLN